MRGRSYHGERDEREYCPSEFCDRCGVRVKEKTVEGRGSESRVVEGTLVWDPVGV